MSWRDVVWGGQLPWLRLDIPVPHEAMAAEAIRLRDRFVDRNAPEAGETTQYSTPSEGWCALALHGLPDGRVGHFSQFGYKSEDEVPYGWTEAAAECPMTVAWLRDVWPMRRLYRARFLLLEAGGSIAAHEDTDLRVLDRASVALQWPEGCHFFIEGEPVPFADGRAFLIDKSRRHWVENPTAVDRVQLVVEGNLGDDPGWGELVERSAAAT